MNNQTEPLITYLRQSGNFKQTGGPYILASGGKSPYYVNLRPGLLEPHGVYIMSQVLDYTIRLYDLQYDSIGGVDMVGRSIVSGLMMGHACGVYAAGNVHQIAPKFIYGFSIRKELKGHGLQNWIDGEVGKQPLLVDDVATSGQSLKDAILRLQQEKGVKPTHVVVLVDRQEGAKELLGQMGIGLLSCATLDELRY